MPFSIYRLFSGRASWWPLAVSLFASAIILLVAAGSALELRASADTRARENSANLLHVIERDIARTIETLGLSLQGAVDGVGRDDVMALAPALRRAVLFDRSATATNLGVLAVYDENGVLVLDSTGDMSRQVESVSDREYFSALRDADLGLFASRPFVSRLLGVPVIGLSRRISKPNGSFAGVAYAAIQLSYFTDLLSKLSLGRDAVVSLVRADGAVIVRLQREARVTPLDLSRSPVFRKMVSGGETGSFVAVSSIDGVERLHTFSRVGSSPLFVSVALPTHEIYADWSKKTAIAGAVLVLVCVAIVGLTALLMRELGRRADAERRLTHVNKVLRRLSRTDALTGLANRRSFDADLEAEVRRSAAIARPLSLMLLDVDHFKLFNDRYGHPKGDAALMTIADVIGTAAAAAGGTAYRIGGEEFALLLPHRPLSVALLVVDTVRADLRLRSIPHLGSPLKRLTASMGVIQVRYETAQQAFARCDAALYRAKCSGRDKASIDEDALRATRFGGATGTNG